MKVRILIRITNIIKRINDFKNYTEHVKNNLDNNPKLVIDWKNRLNRIISDFEKLKELLSNNKEDPNAQKVLKNVEKTLNELRSYKLRLSEE